MYATEVERLRPEICWVISRLAGGSVRMEED